MATKSVQRTTCSAMFEATQVSFRHIHSSLARSIVSTMPFTDMNVLDVICRTCIHHQHCGVPFNFYCMSRTRKEEGLSNQPTGVFMSLSRASPFRILVAWKLPLVALWPAWPVAQGVLELVIEQNAILNKCLVHEIVTCGLQGGIGH